METPNLKYMELTLLFWFPLSCMVMIFFVVSFSGCIDTGTNGDMTNGMDKDINVTESEFNPDATRLEAYWNTSDVIKTSIIKIEVVSDPNATVTINGEVVNLNPDGSFNYEVPVEAPMEIEIRAEAPGKEPSTITIIIEKITSNSLKATINCTGASNIFDSSLPKV